MKIFALMLTRMIIARFLAILLGIAIFVLTLEVVAYAKEILAIRQNSYSIIPLYILLRAPATLATFLPLSLLLSVLLVITELSYRNEFAALWAAGLSPKRLIVLLMPLAVIVGGLHFILSDQAVPAAAPMLRTWGIADYSDKKLKVGERDPIWMRSGPDILRATSANADSTELRDVIIFRRDPDGILREQIVAREAVHEGERWILTDVVVYYRQNLPPSRLDRLVYSGTMRPAASGARSGDPEEMSAVDLAYFIDNAGFGIRPAWVYQSWWHKRIATFFTALVMIALCVPLSTRFRRGGGMGILFAVGVGFGFLFFIVDGIALTMGELGFVTPWLAAWLPIVSFGALSAVLVLHTEQV